MRSVLPAATEDGGSKLSLRTAKRFGSSAVLTVVLLLASLAGITPAARAVSGPQNFINARIADVALRYVGQSRPTGFNQPGECVKWVQSWVAEAGGSMPNGGPLSLYRNAGAVEIPLDQGQRGDIFQISQGDTWNGSPHTGVFTSSRQGDGAFDIVAGNVPAGSGRVITSHYRPSAPAGHELHVWRFGRESASFADARSFNGDGKADVIYQDPNSTNIRVLTSGGGSASGNSVWASGMGMSAWRVAGDFTGDGKADLLYQDPGGTTFYLLISTGSGFSLAPWASGMGQPAWEAAG
jgi:hypothetical protein